MTGFNIPDDPTSRLAEIEARANAATPAPWWVGRAKYDPVAGQYRYDDVPTWIAESSNREQAKADFEFIAAAREDVPWLLARVEELEVALANAAVPIEATLLTDARAHNLCGLSRKEFRNAQKLIRAALGITPAKEGV